MGYRTPDPSDIKKRLLELKERVVDYMLVEDQRICDDAIELIENMVTVNNGLVTDVKHYMAESIKDKQFSFKEKVELLGVD